MMDNDSARMQELLQVHAEKISELDALASAKAEENAILIEKIYQNHKILQEKANGRPRK